ncbi:MAG: hypothetical protein RL701_4271 [Pseudomonadota bacterium]
MNTVIRSWPSVACGLGLCLAACNAEPRYIGDGKLYQVALTADTAPALASEEGGLFIVETRAELPIRRPTSADLSELQSGVARYKKLPFSRLPWVGRDDLPIQVDFTLSNLDSVARNIEVIINGANEFFEYVPGVIQNEDEAPIPLHAQWERSYRLQPRQRITATVREEELDEVAVDLASVVNGAPNSDEIVYFENNSASDPRSAAYIPAVVPGLVALRLGLRGTAAAALLLEASVRVRDEGEKLTDADEMPMQWQPELFESVVPE